MKQKPTKGGEDVRTVSLHTSFNLTHWSNVTNIAMALAQSGYFVNIIKVSESYTLNVFKHHYSPPNPRKKA